MIVCLRILIGLVLVVAGLGKLASGVAVEGETALRLEAMIGSNSASILFLGLSGVELALGLHLVFGLWPRTTSVATLVVLSSFLAASVLDASFHSGDSHGCGCFGALSLWERPGTQYPVWHVLLNGVLVVLAGLVVFTTSREATESTA